MKAIIMQESADKDLGELRRLVKVLKSGLWFRRSRLDLLQVEH
jgi:hypothetical protein